MKKVASLLLLLLCACTNSDQSTKNESRAPDSSKQGTPGITKPQPTEPMDVDSITLACLPWIDSLMDVYIPKTENVLVNKNPDSKKEHPGYMTVCMVQIPPFTSYSI